MSLFDLIISTYPELNDSLDEFVNGSIRLEDDGSGAKIVKWEYKSPITNELKLYVDSTGNK